MTLGLSMIMKNQVKDLKRILGGYGQYFDKIFLTVTHRPTYNKLKNQKLDGKIILSYFEWVDNFGLTREFNRKQIDTDYWFWIDTDDTIDHPEKLREMVDFMLKNELDIMYFNYNYFQNIHGEGINDHRRERIVRTAAPLYWSSVPVHETIMGEFARSVAVEDITIIHHKDEKGIKRSHGRNRKLLLEHFKKTKDPRTAFYLGENFLSEGNARQAAEYYHFLIDNGGWDEEKYDAWLKIADCHYRTKGYPEAIVCTDMALRLFPEKPEGYYMKVMIYGATNELFKAIEWSKVALSKPPIQTLRMVDPTLWQYRGIFMAAQVHLWAGMIKEAYQLYQETDKRASHFIDAHSKETNVDWRKLFEEAYADDKAVDSSRYLLHYAKGMKGKPEKILEALPYRLMADPRLNAERIQLFPPQKWPPKSVAYYCGQGLEDWGPDTLDKGMGGSEEAVIYLSRELSKLGWQVTVFNDREVEYNDNGIIYKPWSLLNPNDEFDVFIASRLPENAMGVKARKVLIDLHDTAEPGRIYAVARANPQAMFMVKSKYHRDWYPEVDDDHIKIVSNGIMRSHFL